MSRINRNIYQNVIANSLNEIDTNWIATGKPYHVYKFRKTSGIIRMTPAGEVSLDNDASYIPQVVNLYTGKEPVVVVWEGSTKLSVDPLTDQIIKTFSVGKYYKMYGVAPISTNTENESITFLSNDFTTQYLDKKITLLSNDWAPTDNDMLDFVYMIIDKRAKCYQWLEIETFIPNYNEETKMVESVEISFSNINLKYASSGKSILDFFQFGAIGEGYAFPKEGVLQEGDDQEIVVEIDKELMVDQGSNSIQIDFMSGAALSSVIVYGREISQPLGTLSYSVGKIGRLFLYENKFPLVSPLFFNQPNANSFWYEGAQPSMNGVWESYKEKGEVFGPIYRDYNVGKTKTIIGGLNMSHALTRNTNPIFNGTYSYQNWGNERIIRLTSTYNFEAVAGIKSANMGTAPLMTFCDFLNFNSFVNFSSDVFSYDFAETTKFKLLDALGIFGGILKIITGGIDNGWTTTKQLAPGQPLNLIFPCISYEMGMIGISKSTALPFEVFNDNKEESVTPLPTNILSSFKFSLTNAIRDISQINTNPVGMGGQGIWFTKYIGQTTFENGDFINADKSPFEFNPTKTSSLSPIGEARFIIDYIGFHAIAQSDIKLSAYYDTIDLTTSEPKSHPVYSSLFETTSKARKDIRIWGNSMKLNFYDKFNTEGTIKWPQTVNAPKPPPKYNVIEANTIVDPTNIISFPYDPAWRPNISAVVSRNVTPGADPDAKWLLILSMYLLKKNLTSYPNTKPTLGTFFLNDFQTPDLKFTDFKNLYISFKIGEFEKYIVIPIDSYISQQWMDENTIRRVYSSFGREIGLEIADKYRGPTIGNWSATIYRLNSQGQEIETRSFKGNIANPLDWDYGIDSNYMYEYQLLVSLKLDTKEMVISFNWIRVIGPSVPGGNQYTAKFEGGPIFLGAWQSTDKQWFTRNVKINAAPPFDTLFTITNFYLEPSTTTIEASVAE